MGKEFNKKEVEKIIKNKNGIILSYKLDERPRRIVIKCGEDGNVWAPTISNIKNGQWCRECYKKSKIRWVDGACVENVLLSKGFILRSTVPEKYWDKIVLFCPSHDHEWTTRFGHLDRGMSNCRWCGFGSLSNDKIQEIVSEKNAEFIRRLPGNNTVQNILLRCLIHNYQWATNQRSIQIYDRWCYHCAWEERKTQSDDIRKLVESMGGALLSPKVNGSKSKILIRCENDHEWETTYDNINGTKWCPICLRKKQTLLYDIIREIYPNLNYKYNYRGFEELKDKNRLEIDIVVHNDDWSFVLAIEYDGEQHFKPISFGGEGSKETKKKFEALKKRDKKKTELIKKSSRIHHFIRFSYTDRLNKEYIIEQLKKNNIPLKGD